MLCLRRASLAIFVLACGCATSQPKVGMEAPGRPALTWHSEDTGTPPAPEVGANKATEKELLAELHEAERTGSDNLALASTLYNLGILRRQQGKLAEAEQLYTRALAIREREQGPNHPDVAVILNNLAGLEAAQGHYAAAQPLLERALAIRETALGGEHVLTAESLNNLALLYAAQDNAAAAEPLYQRAIAILEKTDGLEAADPKKEEPRRAELERVLDNYAALLRDTERDTEAEGIEARARRVHAGERSATNP